MASSAIVDGEFTIPIDAELGITRMRVVMQFNSPGGPCQLSGLAFGEMEDYCVEIIPGELGECDIPSGLDTVNVSTNAANLQWSTVPAALNYLVRYRPVGQEIWTVLTAMNNDLTLQGLSFCTEYEAQVRSVCNDGGSDYSASFIFSTSCSTALKEENTIAKLQVFPNPFSDQFTLGFELQEAVDWLNITVYNTQGQVIYQKHSQPLSSGNHFIPVNIMLPAGIYYVYLATDKGMIAVEKLVRI